MEKLIGITGIKLHKAFVSAVWKMVPQFTDLEIKAGVLRE